MESEQILQESKPYIFGEGGQYVTREDALEALQRDLQRVNTQLAMQRMFDKAETDVIEFKNGYKIAVILRIPRFV